jgi:ABC-type antimicrobial peptide transport system permease subunit
LLTLALNPSIELLLGLPFLMPSFATLAGFAGIVFVVTVIAGPAASAFSVLRLSKVDPGQILREE